jgi:Glycosyltransferase 61
MAGDTWATQARFWAATYRRRALQSSVERLPVATRVDVLHHLEHVDAPTELDLSRANPHSAACLVSSSEVLGPADLRVPADALFPREEGHHWNAVSVHHLRGVTLDQRTGLVFYGNRVLTASGHGWRSARDGAFLSGAYARVASARATEDPRGAIAPMGAAFNYGHFLLETLPRILRILEVEPTVLPVFPHPMPSFAREILTELGISYDVAGSSHPVRSDDVWLCDPTPSGWPHPDDVRMLRATVLDRLGTVGADASGRLFVSRRGILRALQDEDLLEQHLEEQGFTILRPQDLTFRTQVALFKSARVLVGGFGAGHANMIFMSEGSRIVDITTGEWWTPHFRNIARILGQRYDLLHLPADAEYPFGRAVDAIPLLSTSLTVAL